MDVSTRGRDRSSDAFSGDTWTARIACNGRLLDLECLETVGELQALKAAWQALEQRCPEPFTYFQSFDWCMRWCEAFLEGEERTDAQPKVYTLWDGADCVMIWPLMTKRVAASVTVLVPLSAPMNQYASLLYDPARFDLSLGRAVFETVRNRPGRDAICLDHVPDSGLLARIIDGQGYSAATVLQSSIFDLAGVPDWESHHRALPKKQRLQRNSRRNKLEKLGTLDYRVLVPGSDGYAEQVDLCLALKQEWLRSTGRLGGDVFDPRFAAFMRNLGNTGGEDEGRVFLHALTLDGVPIALELGMRFHGDYYCFLGAIDMAFQKYSPGKVQMESAQRWAIETGIRRFDFLNDPSAYKSSWTNTAEPLSACYIPFNRLGELYCRHWMAGLRPRVRALYHRIAPATRARLLSVVGMLSRVVGRNSGSMSLMVCCIP
ncbi:MAG: GNAT family N-acetyltransferase [Rhizobium sp.]|nr:GNAT family N-acetyltransferase [Rhizobium sp.]